MNGRPGAAFNLQQSEISIYHRGNDVREAGREGRRSSFPVGAHERNTKARADLPGCSQPPATPRLSPPLRAAPRSDMHHRASPLRARQHSSSCLHDLRGGNETILPRQTRRPSKPQTAFPRRPSERLTLPVAATGNSSSVWSYGVKPCLKTPSLRRVDQAPHG